MDDIHVAYANTSKDPDAIRRDFSAFTADIVGRVASIQAAAEQSIMT